MLRHTYCAARLQTTDQGAAVSVYTVAKDICALVGAWVLACVAVLFGWNCWRRWVIRRYERQTADRGRRHEDH